MMIFRTDANSQLGIGHLARCRALATALKRLGENCVLVGPALSYSDKNDVHLFNEWIPQVWGNEKQDVLKLVDLAKKFDTKKFILDDYRISDSYQILLRNNGGKWLQFETATSQAIWADIALNASPSAKIENYLPRKKNPSGQLCLGPKYAILRREFVKVNHSDQKPLPKKILVGFGGGDDLGAVQFVLSNLLPITPKDLRFIVISGASNPRNNHNEQWINQHGKNRVDFIVNPHSIACLLTECDIGIIASGTMTYEASCCGLPVILLATANNQLMQSTKSALFLGIYGEVSASDFCSFFQSFYFDFSKRKLMSSYGPQLVDGLGAKRIALKLSKLQD